MMNGVDDVAKISILLSSYNHGDFLKKSIDSILNQTYQDFELIIVDDCSSDDSWSIIKSYKDKRIKKVRNKKNQGSILTRELISSFNGEYFAVAHCDDYWEQTKLEKQLNYMENHPLVGACFSYVELIDEEDNVISSENYINFNISNRSRFEWLNYFFYYGNCLCHPSVLIRKNIQMERDLFAFGLGAFPDFYRWIKLCLSDEIYIYPEKLTYFRVRKGGLNTSGYNYSNVARGSFEECHLLDLYLSLNDKELLEVFPELSKYVVKKYFNKEYAFARLCLEQKKKNYIFYGLNLIYKIFQNDESRLNLEKYYHYTKKDYILDTGKIDFFSTIGSDKIINSTLFFDVGNNYNENDSVHFKILKKSNDNFGVIFRLNDIEVKGLRFDPNEGQYCCCFDLKIYVNGEESSFYSNCSCERDKKYYFYHKDPSFIINFEGKVKEVYIEGTYEQIPSEEVCDYIVNQKIENFINERKIKNRLKHIFYKIIFHGR